MNQKQDAIPLQAWLNQKVTRNNQKIQITLYYSIDRNACLNDSLITKRRKKNAKGRSTLFHIKWGCILQCTCRDSSLFLIYVLHQILNSLLNKSSVSLGQVRKGKHLKGKPEKSSKWKAICKNDLLIVCVRISYYYITLTFHTSLHSMVPWIARSKQLFSTCSAHKHHQNRNRNVVKHFV